MCVSVLILTYNEEGSLPRCLDSLSWTDDVVVFDSFSSDRTTEIARARGARVEQRAFDNYGAQREAARSQVTFKYPWLLVIDADETADDQLVEEIRGVAQSSDTPHAAYRMRRKDHFMGRWIKRSTMYPSWFIRFFKINRVRYETRTVHEYPVVDGEIGELNGHLLHHSFSKGVSAWLSKHNQYSAFEAQESMNILGRRRVDWDGLFLQPDPVRRRRALKELTSRMPGRPLLRFIYMYILRGGILDGRPGLTYCSLLAIYEYMIVIKVRELSHRRRLEAGTERAS